MQPLFRSSLPEPLLLSCAVPLNDGPVCCFSTTQCRNQCSVCCVAHITGTSALRTGAAAARTQAAVAKHVASSAATHAAAATGAHAAGATGVHAAAAARGGMGLLDAALDRLLTSRFGRKFLSAAILARVGRGAMVALPAVGALFVAHLAHQVRACSFVLHRTRNSCHVCASLQV